MPGNDAIELEAEVTAVLPVGRYRVRLANAHELVARVVRRLQERLGPLAAGDVVQISVSPGDFSQGLVTAVLKRITKHESSRIS